MKHQYLILTLCALFVCANFGFQSNNSSPELPPLNFYGTIITRNNETFPFNYLTISGLYKAIPWYAQTKTENENPHSNTTFLNLDQIQSITIHHEQPLIQYKHRKFLTVSLLLRHEQQPLTLLIETNRKVICKQITPAGKELTKEITFDAINQILIQGHRASQETQELPPVALPAVEVTEIKKTVHFND